MSTELRFGRGKIVEIHVITFPSVTHAFRAEKVLSEHGFAVKLIPVPRSLSGSCEGLAARIDETSIAAASDLLTKQGIEMLQKGVLVRAD